MSVFTGACVAMITPFNETGINYDCFGKLIEHYVEGGVGAVCVCGTTGEPSTMTAEEKLAAIDFTVKKVNKRVPVIAGVGANCTATTIENALAAQKLGVDALLIVTPYYNKCTQKGLIAHYTAIASAVELPIITYNVPGRTGVNLLPSTMLELSKVHNIVGIKEASGNVDQLQELLRLCGDKTDVYLGEDALTFVGCALGAKGVISVAANLVPRLMQDICEKAFNGDFAGGRTLQFAVNPTVKNLFCEVNPIPVKKAMCLMGFDAGTPRLPLTEMEDENAERLACSMRELGIIQ